MKKLLVNFFSFSIPLFLLLLIPITIYIKRDVYSDFSPKENYSWKYSFQQLGDLSTKKLLTSTIDYNSFILGSSRTTSIYGCYLQTKIPNSIFFHYANWNETIGGIYRKLNLLDSLGYDLKNVVICLDTDHTFAFTGRPHYYDHYLLTDIPRRKYLISHFQQFFSHVSVDRLKILIGLPVQGDIFPNWQSDLRTNDQRLSLEGKSTAKVRQKHGKRIGVAAV